MKLAVSNIAWDAAEEGEVADALQRLGVRHVEIAPTKVFESPTATSAAERRRYEQFWTDQGISIVAFQSMLFGRPDLMVFGDTPVRTETLDVLSRFMELAGMLGVERLVFGSPKNRVIPDRMGADEAEAIAVDFFSALAQVAEDNNTCFCIEPNPSQYDCNFVTTASEGLALVETVARPGFGLHLDAAGMTLAGDTIGTAIRGAGNQLKHFHASAPYLGQLEDEAVDHTQAAQALRDISYDGCVSIEMRPGAPGSGAHNASAAVALVQARYGV